MFHERMLFNSPYASHPVGVTHGSMDATSVFKVAREAGLLDDTATQEMVGEARMLELISDAVGKRINESISAGKLSDQAAAIVRLFKGSSQERIRTLGFEVAGSAGAAWSGEGPTTRAAINYLIRQGGSIGGGTLEMARNVVAERVLGMPRERRLDKDVPFRDVPRSRSGSG
jgi:alkylation response protein AidB-like acyl-CoA dehydrogenase